MNIDELRLKYKDLLQLRDGLNMRRVAIIERQKVLKEKAVEVLNKIKALDPNVPTDIASFGLYMESLQKKAEEELQKADVALRGLDRNYKVVEDLLKGG